MVERELSFQLASMTTLRLSLRNPDLTTARRIAQTINDLIGQPVAEPLNPTGIRLTLPKHFNGNMVDLITDIEQLNVEPDLPAKIVIDETTGIIVMGQEVRVSTVAIAQGNLTVTVSETPQISQPNAFANGQTAAAPRSNVDVNTDTEKKLALLQGSVPLRDLVSGLNALGVGPRDMISILQAIKGRRRPSGRN